MVASLPIFLMVAGVFLAAALVAWLLFAIIWFVARRVVWASGADEKVDRFLDTIDAAQFVLSPGSMSCPGRSGA